MNLGLSATNLVVESVKSAKISDYYSASGPSRKAGISVHPKISVTEASDKVLLDCKEISNGMEECPRGMELGMVRMRRQTTNTQDIDVEGFTPTSPVPDEDNEDLGCDAYPTVADPSPRKTVSDGGLGFTKSPSKVKANEILETEVAEALLLESGNRQEVECREKHKEEQPFTSLKQPYSSVVNLNLNASASYVERTAGSKNSKVSELPVNIEDCRHPVNETHIPSAVEKIDNHETDFCRAYLKPCDKCDELVPVWDMMTHTDYHVALELQNNVGGFHLTKPVLVKKPDVCGQKRVSGTSNRGQGSKRGRNSKHSSACGESSGMRKLDSYFLPK